MRRNTICVSILIWAATACSQERPYTIPLCGHDGRAFPMAGNQIMTADSGYFLTRVESTPQLCDGRMLLRRRFGPKEYGLYIGRRNYEAYASLCAFQPPRDLGAEDFVARKLYLLPGDNPNLDLTNVYFDRDLIYVENAARIYYYENGWRSIEMVVRDPTYLTILSSPKGARVYVDGVHKGETPLRVGALYRPHVVLRLRKEGYYLAEVFVDLDGAKEVTKSLSLDKMPTQVEGVYIDPGTVVSENEESLGELDRKVAALEMDLDVRTVLNTEIMVQFEKEYPAFPKQGEFEKTATYNERLQLYLDRKAGEKMALVAKTNPALQRARRELLELKNYKAAIRNRMYHRYLSTAGMELLRYNPDLEYFPVRIAVAEQGHDFSFVGSLPVPIAAAPDLKLNLARGRLKLSYRNRMEPSDSGSARSRILYEYTELGIAYKGVTYRLEGKCSMDGQECAERPDAHPRELRGDVAGAFR